MIFDSRCAESPRWLLSQHYDGHAQRALVKLRGAFVSVEEEFTEMKSGLANKYGRDNCCDVLFNAPLLLRCIGCMLFNALLPLLGIQLVYLFTDELTDILGMHSSTLGIALALCGGLVGGVVSYFHLDYWGRRFVLLGGCCFMCVSWLLAAGCVMVGELEKGAAEAFETSRVLSFLFGDFFALFSLAFALSVTQNVQRNNSIYMNVPFGKVGPISISMPVEMFAFEARPT